MKCTSNKQENVMEQVQKLLKERGSRALEEARRTVLQEEVECKEVREALAYFMNEYCRDLARPTLLSMACEAVGGDPEITTPVAVPMILINGAIDVHDDIIDQSRKKRGRLTVYGKYGKDVALIVGDALLFKGFILLHEANKKVPVEKMDYIISIIENAFVELGDAEALELEFRRRLDVAPEEYLHMIEKRAANVEAHTVIGAILGGGTPIEIDALGKYGRILGTLLIIQDEFIDMLDAEEFRHRTKYECLPLPLLYALQNPKIKQKVDRILKRGITKRDMETLLSIVNSSKEVKDLETMVRGLADESYSQLHKLEYDKTSLRLLISSLLEIFRSQ